MDNTDPRFSLAFLGVTSDKDEIRYSYVKKSTFHSGFNTAIGVFAVDGLEVDENVVYHTVGAGRILPFFATYNYKKPYMTQTVQSM